jgi:hypothetical protein
MKVDFELTGETPFLMHADNIDAADELTAWRKAPENKNLSVAGDDRSPAWTWQMYLYTDGESIAIPQQNIMCCLRVAGAQVSLKGSKTFKEITQSGIVMDAEFCEFLVDGKKIAINKMPARSKTFTENREAAARLGFALNVKRAKIGKAKHIRVRSQFDKWSVRGTLNVYAPELSKEVIEQLFHLGGRGGLGDWRPSGKTPGPYGMFTAKLKFK